MRRNDLLRWTGDLSPDERAQALAALGVVQTVAPRWPLSNDAGTVAFLLQRALENRRVVWKLLWAGAADLRLVSPEVMAEAWRRALAQSPPPFLEIQATGRTDWLLALLAQPAVGAAEVALWEPPRTRGMPFGEPEEPLVYAGHGGGRRTRSAPARSAAPEAIEKPGLRFLQAQVYDQSVEGPLKRVRRAFRAGATHSVRVRVGFTDKAWLSPAPSTPFPVEQLPEDETEHRLQVVFTEPALLEEPISAEILLPKGGNSTSCAFRIFIPEDAKRVDGRLIVLYRNRVLQTALLRGPVAREPARAYERPNIELEVEAVLRPGLVDLAERRPFDAVLLLNHDSRAVPRLTRIADDHAEILAASELQEIGEWFDRRLSEVATSRRDFEGGLGAAATVELLRDFATHGSLLYDYLVKDMLGENRFAGDGSVQILSTRADAWLPVEFVYDRKAPHTDAPLCPNAAEALRAGRCDDACPTGREAATCICPLGFWGMRRVLERHAHDPSFARSLRGVDFALQAEPVEGRQTLSVLGDTLLAASQRVGKSCPGSLDEIARTVEAVTGRAPRRAESWSDWVASISEGERPLQVLLVHTDRVSEGGLLQKMEIGEDSWLSVANLDESYVRDRPEKRPPLVLLLGCETGAPEISFLGFVGKFRRSGAAIVLSTGSTVHSVHAVPVAKRYLEVLARLIREGGATTFGEVMRTARRELLADGYPMVLCLAAYGDADWRLTG